MLGVFREKKGMTQKALADQCLGRYGLVVSVPAISRFENTGAGLGTRRLLAISEILECSLWDLIGYGPVNDVIEVVDDAGEGEERIPSRSCTFGYKGENNE